MPCTVKRNNQTGFTLLELLISIIIISVIISIMFSAMRLGTRAWEKGEHDIEFMNRIRIVKTQMNRQLASLCTESFLKSEKSRDPVPFIVRGDEQSIEFLSRYSIIPGIKKDLVYVKYYIKTTPGDTDTLMVFEKDVAILDFKKIQELSKELDNDQAYVLLEDIDDFELEYLIGNKDRSTEWMSSWNMDGTEKKFPLAVKFTARVEDIPLTVIGRFMSAEHEVQQ